MATFNGTEGNDTLIGGAAVDDLHGFGGNDFLQGGDGADVVLGDAGNDSMSGNAGNDWVRGGTGNDQVTGGGGQDSFAFADFGSANADTVTDFGSNWDNFQLDRAAFTALGNTGRFVSGDVRFFAGTAAHDADDRIIYNQTTGQLWYDADGNGAGAAQLIATLSNRAAVTATDIYVFATAGGAGGSTINGTSGNDALVGTAGNDTMNGLAGHDTVNGAGGADSVIGGDGNDALIGGAFPDGSFDTAVDTLDGGLGNDTFTVNAGDVILPDAGGIDQVNAWNTSWTLAASLEDLNIVNNVGGTHLTGTGNGLANRIEAIDNGSAPSTGTSLFGMGGNDLLLSNWNVRTDAHGGDGDDTVYGASADDQLFGDAGIDHLVGREGADTIAGGAGADSFIFDFLGHADALTDFASGVDKLRFDARTFTQIGSTGNFAAGDARFHAGAAAHDADDRIIFDAATGNLWYDEDGNGSGVAALVARVTGTVTATDVAVDNGTGAQVINGTAGNDTLTGGESSDTINGLAGDDSLTGLAGGDSLSGGDGNDTVDGHNHRTFDSDLDVDTLAGGFGNDVLMVDNAADVVVDAGGVDTIIAHNVSWRLGASFENLVVHNDNDGPIQGFGNALDNVLGRLHEGWFLQLDGLGGNDTLYGSSQNDTLLGGDGNDWIESAGDVDIMDGGAGNDTLESSQFDDDDMWGGTGADHFAVSTPGEFANRVHDFETGIDKLRIDGARMANVGASGNFSVGDARFHAGLAAHDADDRVIWDGSSLWYDPDGTGAAAQQRVAIVTGSVVASDIFVVNGTAGGILVNGTAGNDSLAGGAGNDTLNGLAGIDTLDGGAGADSMTGGSGDDLYFVDDLGDVTAELENGGIDQVRFSIESATLAQWLNHGTLIGSAVTLTGNDIANALAGNALGNSLFGLGDADTLLGAGGNDNLEGGDGIDRLEGGAGNDTLNGGAGADNLVLAQSGATNAELILGMETGVDTITLDAGTLTALGVSGRFSATDVRFWSAPGASSGHDADDRVIFNQSTAQLFYDPDGSGAAAAQLLATVTGNFPQATDIVVENGAPPVTAGTLYNGTSAANAFTGGAGNDTLNGNDGNDTLAGAGGNDAVNGNSGNDQIEGGTGNDTLSGSGGQDSFVFREAGTGNADTANNFASNWDRILLDNAGLVALGGDGRFASGDARFFAGAGANAGQDLSDRVVYNTSTGQLWYDADGSAGGAAQLIATFTGAPGLIATDVTVL